MLQKVQLKQLLAKATANETKLNTIPEMPENDGKIYGFCNGAWVVIAEVGKNVYTDCFCE